MQKGLSYQAMRKDHRVITINLGDLGNSEFLKRKYLSVLESFTDCSLLSKFMILFIHRDLAPISANSYLITNQM